MFNLSFYNYEIREFPAEEAILQMWIFLAFTRGVMEIWMEMLRNGPVLMFLTQIPPRATDCYSLSSVILKIVRYQANLLLRHDSNLSHASYKFDFTCHVYRNGLTQVFPNAFQC